MALLPPAQGASPVYRLLDIEVDFERLDTRSRDIIMQVCRHWRMVALDTIGLWRRVVIRTAADRVFSSIRRSKNAPLEITLHRDAEFDYLRCLTPLLFYTSYRLRSLRVTNGTSAILDLLQCTLLNLATLPQLYELVVVGTEPVFHSLSAGYLVSLQVQSRFPALRVLSLASLYIGWTYPVFRQLRILNIADAAIPAHLRFAGFLQLLGTFQCLEELDFTFVCFRGPRSSAKEDGHPPPSPLIVSESLPRLRSFRWQWPIVWSRNSPSDVYLLLQRIQFSPSVDIAIELEVDEESEQDEDSSEDSDVDSLEDDAEGEDELCAAYRMDYANVIPREPDCLPILGSATTASLLSSWGTRLTYLECEGDDGQGSFRVIFTCQALVSARWLHSRNPGYRSQQLDDFRTIFARAPLTSLTIELYYIQYSPLVDILRHFSRISTLEVRGDLLELKQNDTRILFAALTQPLASGESLGHTPFPSVVLPALHTLRLDTIPWSGHLLCALLSTLALRLAKHNAPPLANLCILAHCDGNARTAELVESHQTMLVALEALVRGRVEYAECVDEEEA